MDTDCGRKKNKLTMSRIELIIPAFNEEKRIGKTLKAYLDFFGEELRCTVVLNGCYDQTKEVVEKLAKQFPERVHLWDLKTTTGKGRAIRYGWRNADADYLGFVDADCATTPPEFAKLITAIKNYDGAIASRFLKGATVHQRQSILRTWLSHGFIMFVRFLFRLPFYDTQCGAKLFTKKAIKNILPKLKEDGMIFDVELLWKLHQAGNKIIEVPTAWTDRPGSNSLGTKKQFLTQALKM